jgi:hypothetical protein
MASSELHPITSALTVPGCYFRCERLSGGQFFPFFPASAQHER